MTAENQDSQIKRAEAYLEVLKKIAQEKGLSSYNWSVVRFPQHNIEAEFVVQKEKPDGEIIICQVPEDFQIPINEVSNL